MPKDFDKHDVECQKIAIAWVRSKVETHEVQKRFGNIGVAFTLYRIAAALREAVKRGRWK